MAIVQASFAFDMNALNFFQVTSHAYDGAFLDDVNVTVNGRLYSDVVTVSWLDGADYQSTLGGSGITVTPGNIITGGTVTGYLQTVWNGSTYQPVWSIEDMSVSAVALYQTFITPSAADELALVQSILDGADTFLGSAFADTVASFGGNDLLRGGGGQDILDGGTGLDTGDYSDKSLAIAVTLAGASNATVNVGGVAEDAIRNIENVTGGSGSDAITGDGLANVLKGGGGADTLKGGLGKDTLDGGTGLDTADYGDKTLAIAVTLAGNANATVKVGGVAEDKIKAIENVTGGAGNDSIAGDGLANILRGGGGNDTLKGRGGFDQLTGNGGKDTFVFDQPLVAGNITTIVDLTHGSDIVALARTVFAAGPAGTLKASAFFAGSAAHDANDRIIYNAANGQLMFDADGTGAAAAQTFAVAGSGLALTASDFKLL